MVYCACKENLKLLIFIKAIDHTSYGFTGVITHLGCWKNTPKTCKSQAESRVGHHASKPIESVVYCLNKGR